MAESCEQVGVPPNIVARLSNRLGHLLILASSRSSHPGHEPVEPHTQQCAGMISRGAQMVTIEINLHIGPDISV